MAKEMKTLAQYLAEYLAEGVDRLHKKGLPMDFSKDSLCPVIEKGIKAYEATEGVTVSVVKTDKCEVCKGTKGGVPGNENIIGSVIMCDYCHAERMGKEADMAPADKPVIMQRKHRYKLVLSVDANDETELVATQEDVAYSEAINRLGYYIVEEQVAPADGSVVKKRERIYALAITHILEIEKERWEKKCGYDQEVNDVATDALLAGEAIGDNTSDNS